MEHNETERGSGSCETVRIVATNEQGYVVINKADFNDAVHILWQPAEVAPVAVPVKK